MRGGPKVLLRGDANGKIGYGHLSRLLAIANFLSPSFSICLLTDCNSSIFIEPFKELGVNVFHRDQPLVYSHLGSDTEVDFDLLDTGLHLGDIVVLDGYHFGIAYRSKCKEMGFKVVLIDDFALSSEFCDVILNHAPGIDRSWFNVPSSVKVLTGLSVAMLRPSFLLPQNTSIDRRNGFVCFGGLDSLCLSVPAARFLLHNPVLEKVYVLISSVTSPKLRNMLAETKAQYPHLLEIRQNLQALEISQILDTVSYAVVAPSTVLFESYFRGCHCISGLTADNQKLILDGFVQSNYAFSLGDLREEQAVFSAPQELWDSISDFRFSLLAGSFHPQSTFLELFHAL